MKKIVYAFIFSSLLLGLLYGCSDDDKINIKRVSSIEIEELPEKGLSVEEGHSLQLKVKVLPEDADNKKLKFESSNIDAFTIDNTGLIQAIKPGEGLITISATDGSGVYARSLFVSTAKFQAVENVAIEGIADDSRVLNIMVGEPVDISIAVAPSNATNKDVLVESLDESIFTVTKFVDAGTGEVKYRVTGVDAGVATDKLQISTTDGSDIVEKYTVKVRKYVELPRTDWLIIDKSSVQENETGSASVKWDKAIFDGLNTTYWHSNWGQAGNEPPHWIVIDMQAEYEIEKVKLGLREGASGTLNSYLEDVEISTALEYKDSDSEFEDAVFYKYSHPKTANDQNREFKFTPRMARYVKIYFPTSYRTDTNQSVNLGEFWAYKISEN